MKSPNKRTPASKHKPTAARNEQPVIITRKELAELRHLYENLIQPRVNAITAKLQRGGQIEAGTLNGKDIPVQESDLRIVQLFFKPVYVALTDFLPALSKDSTDAPLEGR